jgi:hypothetical protein
VHEVPRSVFRFSCNGGSRGRKIPLILSNRQSHGATSTSQRVPEADKLSHHAFADAYLKLSVVDKKLGNFSSALDEAKKAVRAAGDDKTGATQAHLAHANLLVQMSSKPGDKKLQGGGGTHPPGACMEFFAGL